MTCVLAVCLLVGAALAGLQSTPFVIPLTMNEQEGSFVHYGIALPGELTGSRSGMAKGNVAIRVEPTGSNHAYRVYVQDQRPIIMSPGEDARVRVKRSWPERKDQVWPYDLLYRRSVSADGQQVFENFSWRSGYRAEGQLEANGCLALLVVFDLNADGVFAQDEPGTSLGLDRNGDGRIYGADEYLKNREPIEFCGRAFQVEGVAPDGSSITLRERELRVPRIGDALPATTFTDFQGRQTEVGSRQPKVMVLDFWASWCVPCIEKIPELQKIQQEFPSTLAVLSYNVDAAEDLEQAREVIRKYKVTWPVVMRGLAETDPWWRSIGSMKNNHMGIPLYVVVDRQGRIRVATNGNKELRDLRDAVAKILEENR